MICNVINKKTPIYLTNSATRKIGFDLEESFRPMIRQSLVTKTAWRRCLLILRGLLLNTG